MLERSTRYMAHLQDHAQSLDKAMILRYHRRIKLERFGFVLLPFNMGKYFPTHQEVRTILCNTHATLDDLSIIATHHTVSHILFGQFWQLKGKFIKHSMRAAQRARCQPLLEADAKLLTTRAQVIFQHLDITDEATGAAIGRNHTYNRIMFYM